MRLLRTPAHPRAIAIIDGLFEAVPAVLHKEILYALHLGVPVLGAASMGALRAAELHVHGMIGVGRIFEAFRDGVLVDDDEVAVLHGPEEAGYAAVSTALVDIRATLERALREDVLDRCAHDLLLSIAKDLHYGERSWRRLLAGGRDAGIPESTLGRLADWLPDGRVEQKRRDAQALVDLLVRNASAPPAPVPGTFAWTESFWHLFHASAPGDPPSEDEWAVLDELRLDPAMLETVLPRARLAERILRPSPHEPPEPSPQELSATRAKILRRHGLFDRKDRARWLRRNDLDEAAFERLVHREARLEAAAFSTIAVELLHELRIRGLYGRLASRARRKRERLARQGLWNLAPSRMGISAAALRLWYFESLLRRNAPDDPQEWARRHAFRDVDDFSRALLNEWLYHRLACRSRDDLPIRGSGRRA